MNKNVLLVFVAGTLSFSLFAQKKKMETDRPGESQNPALTEKGYVQLETGFFKEQRQGDYSLLHPDALVKYGLSKEVEFRMEINAETDKFYSENDFRYGLKPVEFGFKLNIIE